MGHVLLGRLDQVEDEVESAAQLNVDLGEGILVAVASPDQTVVDDDRRDDQQRDDDGNHYAGDEPHTASSRSVPPP